MNDKVNHSNVKYPSTSQFRNALLISGVVGGFNGGVHAYTGVINNTDNPKTNNKPFTFFMFKPPTLQTIHILPNKCFH